MQLFRLNQKYLAIMGIEAFQPFSENQPLIVFVRRLLVLISLTICVILSSVFLAYEAKTLNEYADSFYGFATTTAIFFLFTIFLWKMDSLFKLIVDFEKLIEQRKIRI